MTVIDGPGRGTQLPPERRKPKLAGAAQRQIREVVVEVESTSEENVLGSDDEVRCFCDKREIGETVQCEVCVGWFHFGVFKNEGRQCTGWKDLRMLFLPVGENVGIDKVGR